MRKLNCVLVPIPDEDGCFLKIGFPETEKSDEELLAIKNPEIVVALNTEMDRLQHDSKLPEHFNVTDEYLVRSISTALDHYWIITNRGK